MNAHIIHSLAYIHPNSIIGENVTIDPFTVIKDDVEIGAGTWIGSNVTIMEGTRIGENCMIFPGAVLGAIPQDLKFVGEKTYVFIGDYTVVREFVTINRGTSASGKTVVGTNCLLQAYSHVAHDCIIGNNCIISNNSQFAGHVIVDDYAVIGGVTAMHQFVHVGQHAFVGGGSLVRKDVPPFIKAINEPLSYGGVNSIGLKRRGFTLEQINNISDIYRSIYNKGMNITKAVDYVEENMPYTEERDEILSFIRESSRGIIKRLNKNGDTED